ncbi:hypothetical protein STRCI_008308 [Streptomyces cinnabarinus]|uniref:Uncharacterized protein n=1 Tax=Streptomyces cinnabarinus TaxID=67287 RepID=A0ABY7KUC3_9ACTN|nr:hypothetical protein [Streptomyces cinnabarinus]WAZ26692.1 hypothetical protein STRCI_008308 [Streptomyces cinnabarinus]
MSLELDQVMDEIVSAVRDAISRARSRNTAPRVLCHAEDASEQNLRPGVVAEDPAE